LRVVEVVSHYEDGHLQKRWDGLERVVWQELALYEGVSSGHFWERRGF